MINHYDIAYGIGVGLASPFWLAKPSARKKVLSAFSQRMGHVPARDLSKPAVMIHAVSLGEINATPALVDLLRQRRPDLHFVISVTTETGYAQGRKLYGSASDVTLVRYPLDFSPAVDRLLNAMRPKVVALLELEVWPNFIRRCATRNVPVLLINGRITASSFSGYKLVRPLVGAMFSRLHRVCAQDQTFADRFTELGVPPSRVQITGTMKFDTAQIADQIEGQYELASAVGLIPTDPIWICGSTGPGEEAMILPLYRRLQNKFPGLRLVIVPRKKERFEEVAALIQSENFPVVRRSNPEVKPNAVILGDTFGDLRKFYALATVVFVGRTLVDLGPRQHGSDMIEPAALAKPTIVGPFTGNFAAAMNRFIDANAIKVVPSAGALEIEFEKLLSDPASAAEMGRRARDVVRREQGATAKHADAILEALG